MNPCWMFQCAPPICFVHLGKFGDIMIMLPAFKAISDETGIPPTCVVCKDFASIFDGVSYVHPWVMDLNWWKGVPVARKAVESIGIKPIVVKWWDDPEANPAFEPSDNVVTLKIHGTSQVVPASEWDSFQNSQWRYAGFTMEQMAQWPLVFDRRNFEREAVLRARTFKPGARHLLVNVSRGGTSPFPNSAQAMALCHRSGVSIVNLQSVRAERIYDLLGLYDHAIGMVTSDTATLHLAAASKIPYIAIINNGGSGSSPKGNCILKIRYAEFPNRLGEYCQALDELCST